MRRRVTREERRKGRRYKTAVNATIFVDDGQYNARVYDINRAGMTLLTGPEVPDCNHYRVTCVLSNDQTATFWVEEMQRRSLRRGQHHFLRLGLRMVDSTDDVEDFFVNLTEVLTKQWAKQDRKRLMKTGPRKRGTSIEIFPDEPERKGGEAGIRGYDRIAFQLPVMAKIDGKIYKCVSVDISARGLSVQAPVSFPHTKEVFPLIYLDPDGGEVKLKVRQINRVDLEDQAGWIRLGLRAIGGSREFKDFLKKHKLWQIDR